MNVLLLTEELGDRVLFQETLKGMSREHTLTTCESVEEVWTKLNSRTIPLPSLILVDLDLARSYDHELVQLLRDLPDLGVAPIIVFANSAEPAELKTIYGGQVSCVVMLPGEGGLRRAKIRACLEFWTTQVVLPELGGWWPSKTGLS
jgi:CheY-like chemotaxis protein